MHTHRYALNLRQGKAAEAVSKFPPIHWLLLSAKWHGTSAAKGHCGEGLGLITVVELGRWQPQTPAAVK